MTQDTAPEWIWAIETTEETNTPDPNRYGVWDTEQDGQEGEVEYVRKDLFDAARKVKDLVWRSDRGNCQQYANSLIGEIRVTVFGGSWFYKGDCFGANEVGLELAKAAAQADYERRILSALDQGGAE